LAGRVVTAAVELTRRLADLAGQCRATPCQGRRRDRWTSDDATDRAWAASICSSLGCSALVECGAAADEHAEKHHVWGGVDRTTDTPKPKRES